MRRPKREDHNAALSRVRCDACGKEQANDVKKCRGCGHEFGTYAAEYRRIHGHFPGESG